MIKRLGYFALLVVIGGTAAILKKLAAEASADGEAAESAESADTGTEPEARKPSKATKLTKISGIGPKLEEHLIAAGIGNCEDLAKSSTGELQKLLDEAGSRFRLQDPSSWIEQAELASAGKWDELAELQEKLKA